MQISTTITSWKYTITVSQTAAVISWQSRAFLLGLTALSMSFLHTLWMNTHCWVYPSSYRSLPTQLFTVWHRQPIQPIPPLEEEVTHRASPTVPCWFSSSQNNLGRRQFKYKILCIWSYLEISSTLPAYPKHSLKYRRNLLQMLQWTRPFVVIKGSHSFKLLHDFSLW